MLVAAIGKMPRMAEWPDDGAQAQFLKHCRKQIQQYLRWALARTKGEFAPENPARS
jgi:hypothetical protein